jgi:hypothetical protein
MEAVINDGVVGGTDILAAGKSHRFVVGVVNGDVTSFKASEATLPYVIVSLVVHEVVIQHFEGLFENVNERTFLWIKSAEL